MCTPDRADHPLGGSRRLCVDPDMIPTAMGSHFSAREARLFFGAREARQTIRFDLRLFLGGSRRLCVDPDGHVIFGARNAPAVFRRAKRAKTLDAICVCCWVGCDGSAWIPTAVG